MAKDKYYSLDKIKKAGATYNVIFGKRSNGKSYAVLNEILLNFFKNGKQSAIIRRVYEDFRANRGANVFTALVNNGLVEKYSNGQFTGIVYYNRAWYFANYDENIDKWVKCETPFCYAFSLNAVEHDKSTSYPGVTLVLFDEFISRYSYLTDEFILFQNCLSTIIRDRVDVTIYMLGNTINVYCPYFNEMGLNHVKQMKPGDIDLYTYGENKDLTVAVEYCETGVKTKAGSKYFSFDNPKLNMINSGIWELDIYPHLPEKYRPSNVVFRCQIEFDNEKLTLEVICTNSLWGYIHPLTKDIDYDNDYVLSVNDSPRPNVCSNFYRSVTPWVKRIRALFMENRIFYSDNTVGCTIENFLATSKTKAKI